MSNRKSLPAPSHAVWTPLAMLGLGLAVLTGCSNKRNDCQETATCPVEGSGGAGQESTAGTAGIGATVGSAGVGGASGGMASLLTSDGLGGTTGIAGANAGPIADNASLQTTAAGAAGNPARVHCGGVCTGGTPLCNEATNTCVECLDSSQCSGATPYCYTRLNFCAPMTAENCAWTASTPAYSKEKQRCVACLANSDCKDPSRPFCNTTTNACVACFSNSDCKDVAKSHCDTSTNACVPCAQDNDCNQIEGKHVCSGGTCVQCTGTKYSECGQLNGQALICDSSTQKCSLDRTVGSGDACTPCISDAQCKAGQLCAEQYFDSRVVGLFCFWREGDTANGAPATCASGTARPYIAANTTRSIEGTNATLCGLRKSTCKALNQFAKTSCSTNGVPANSMCGVYPGVDSACVQDTSTSSYLCTVTCNADEDCPRNASGSLTKCDLYATPHVCTFR